tara:strand:+ start:330 stop:1037 length:708 start_codon:yes stop_codon:yes gene_type:complete
VVEDEPDILEVLRYNLAREGYKVSTVQDGTKGLQLIQDQQPDLVLLDLMLPGMDGLGVCRHLKSSDATKTIPVIMLTAKGEESDIVLGLGIGADDYITKPFSPKELVARVRAVLRRFKASPSASKQQIIEVDKLSIDINKHQVLVNGKEIILTATEFRLLTYLASNPSRVFSREQLLDRAFVNGAVVVDRNIDVHIRGIRKKIDPVQGYIETIRGVGYRFKDYEPSAETHQLKSV